MFVLLDSNVWLAALAHDGVCRRVLQSAAAFCTPVVTPFLCAEVREKLVTRFHRTEEQADELVSKLISATENGVASKHLTLLGANAQA